MPHCSRGFGHFNGWRAARRQGREITLRTPLNAVAMFRVPGINQLGIEEAAQASSPFLIGYI
jgi:hypothetical protein